MKPRRNKNTKGKLYSCGRRGEMIRGAVDMSVVLRPIEESTRRPASHQNSTAIPESLNNRSRRPLTSERNNRSRPFESGGVNYVLELIGDCGDVVINPWLGFNRNEVEDHLFTLSSTVLLFQLAVEAVLQDSKFQKSTSFVYRECIRAIIHAGTGELGCCCSTEMGCSPAQCCAAGNPPGLVWSESLGSYTNPSLTPLVLPIDDTFAIALCQLILRTLVPSTLSPETPPSNVSSPQKSSHEALVETFPHNTARSDENKQGLTSRQTVTNKLGRLIVENDPIRNRDGLTNSRLDEIESYQTLVEALYKCCVARYLPIGIHHCFLAHKRLSRLKDF